MSFVLFLGILLVLGLVSTRVVKIINLPNVTGYLIVGFLAALFCIFVDFSTGKDYYGAELNKLNEYISLVALGFIALSIGEEFKLSKIKEYGSKIITITLFQSLLAVIFVDVALIVACNLLGLSLSIAIALGAIATATAPAATLMVIHQYNAKGPLVDILLPVVAFDDAVGLIVFSISISISEIIVSGAPLSFISIGLIPLIEIVGSIVLGALLGFLMRLLIKFFKSRNNHMIVIIAFTLLGVGLCELAGLIEINGRHLEFSNLLCCMMIGAFYVNLAKDEEREIVTRDFGLIDRWTPSLFMLFFVLSGAHLALSAKEIITSNDTSFLILVGIIFICYLIMRSLGKYLGAFIGCKITKRDKEITNYLGITLLPQAGVAIGMANQISSMDVFKGDNIGNIIVTVVLCATLVYEIIGPLLTKWCLNKTGEIPDDNGIYPFELVETN